MIVEALGLCMKRSTSATSLAPAHLRLKTVGALPGCGIIDNKAMYRLVFQNRAAPKEPVVVELPSLVIGRDAGCNIQLVEPGVSGRHAAIERQAGGYYLHDLDSVGGVCINGKPIMEGRLSSGDELEIGGARLRFEIIHGVGSKQRRRPVDLLQVLAIVIVLLVIGGQVALLSSMFSEDRPRKVKLETALVTHPDQATVASTDSVTTHAPPVNEPHPPAVVAASAQPVAEPAVLNRMIRIVRVDRTESSGAVNISVQVKAQVGERELSTGMVGICVQFAALGGTGSSVVWRDPIWLPIPQWENFSSKSFSIHFPGAPREFVGFVVRTYYRKQMQDVAAAPPSLRPLVPLPLLGGAS
jgi:pSer/pThr/pTyr-binding forkhead associated (FHA) protein